jgi:hypothetical protein
VNKGEGTGSRDIPLKGFLRKRSEWEKNETLISADSEGKVGERKKRRCKRIKHVN